MYDILYITYYIFYSVYYGDYGGLLYWAFLGFLGLTVCLCDRTAEACHELLQSAERFSWEAPAWYDPESAAFSVFSQGQYAHRSTVSIPGGLGQPVTLGEGVKWLSKVIPCQESGLSTVDSFRSFALLRSSNFMKGHLHAS